MGRITWVCATRSEPFTRRYGANRHNNNLHGGKGTVVRLLDYIVGIATGRFLPRDDNVPSGRKARQSSFFSLKLRHNYQQTTYQSVVHENTSSKPVYKQTNSGTTDTYSKSDSSYQFDNYSRPLEREDNHRNADKLSSGLAPSIDEVHMRPKLQEVHSLLNKHYPHSHANQFFTLATHMAIIGDSDYIDKVLAFLREFDRQSINYEKLFDMLSNRTDKMDKFHDKIGLNLPQQVSAKIQHKMSPERYLQGKATLAAIEQLLSPYYPQEFVRNVITCLRKEFDITGDLSSLNTAFENHLKNAQRYMRLS
jgi:hypothetical protein